FLPAAARGMRCGYQKLRPRAAIHFPMLSVAFAARVADGVCEGAGLVVSAIAARPRVISGVAALVRGKPLDEALPEGLARGGHEQCHPLIHVPYDQDCRGEVVPVFVRRAVREAFAEARA